MFFEEDTTYNFNKTTVAYARFHKSLSWREGSADFNCFDAENPYFCPDSNSIGGIRSYLQPVGSDSFDIALNIYTPQVQSNNLRPTILFTHGSGLLPNNSYDKDDPGIDELAEVYVEAGYNFVAIDYRKGWETHYVNLPELFLSRLFCFFYTCSFNGDSDAALEHSYTMALFKSTQDLLAAHRYIHFNAAEYNIDTDNIFYYGISTGGIISLSACFADNSEWNEKLQPYYGEQDVNAFGKYRELSDDISIAGIVSLSSGIPEVDWISETEAINTPLFLIHGTKDYISPYIKGNVLAIAGYKDSPQRGEVFKLYGSKAIYDHIRKIDPDHAQVKLNSLYNLEHNVADDVNLICPLFLRDDMFKFLSKIRNTGSFNNSEHVRYTNFVDSTLLCGNRKNDIYYGKSFFKGDRFMYMINGLEEDYINGFEFGEHDFTIEASITPNFRRSNRANIVSTKLPAFIEKKGYDFGITNKRKLFLHVSDENGQSTYESSAILEKDACSHVAVTRKDSTLIFYVNGEPTDTFLNVKDRLLNTSIVWIGNGLSRPNSGFSGSMEYLRFWKSGFDQSVINYMMQEGTGLVFPNSELTAFFDFTENEGQLFTEYVNGYQAISGLLPFGYLGDPVWIAAEDNGECGNLGGREQPVLKDKNPQKRIIQDQSITVYPNPFQSYIKIDGLNKSLQNYQIVLTTISGQSIQQDIRLVGINKIDLSTLASGFYWVIIKDGDTIITITKVIKL